jgi:hypothetical protein
MGIAGHSQTFSLSSSEMRHSVKLIPERALRSTSGEVEEIESACFERRGTH